MWSIIVEPPSLVPELPNVRRTDGQNCSGVF